jgi:hypothetical protein
MKTRPHPVRATLVAVGSRRAKACVVGLFARLKAPLVERRFVERLTTIC